MPASEVSICNLALAEIGQERISALGEATQEGRWCATLYEPTRDELLRAHPWNFATKRTALSKLADAPLFGWDYQFQLPSDFLRLRQLNGCREYDDTKYQIEGRALLTDEEEANIRYIYRVTDCGLFDALFVKALAIALAAELCVPIKNDANLAASIVRKLEGLNLPRARTVDSNEDRPKTRRAWQNSELVRARVRRGFF